jgi:hypothetical protein
MGFAIRILEPSWPLRLPIIVCTYDIWLTLKNIQACWLEKMHIQALLASKMFVGSAVCHPSIGFSSLHLYIIYDIRCDII